MKIPANSFGLDMNAMLNEMNGQRIHGYYNKMIANNSRNIQKIRNRFNYQIKHNRNDSRILGKELADEINKNRANDEAMWNHAIPKKIREAMDQTLDQVPSSTVYYYPPGQYPSDPSPGDIVWHIPDPSQFGSNNIKASAERYYKNGGWHEIKGANQDVFGADIMGANIKGGEITGAEFRSNEQANRQHAAFSVNAEGRVYAQNFTADLAHEVRGEQLNPINYNGYVDSGEGFNLANGILGMTATADQMGGKFIWSDHPNMKGNTLLEPGYLKLRYFRDNGSNFVRTDLRAGVLQIAGNTWNQDAGIRLGYWNTTGPHITLGDWDSIEDMNGNLDISNSQNMREIDLHSPLNLVNGDLLLNGDVKLKGESNENLRDRLRGHESTLNSHYVKISNHGEILDGNDDSDTLNVINGRYNPNSHKNRLDKHNRRLNTHRDVLKDKNGNLSTSQNRFQDLQNTINNRLDIAKGVNGNIAFTDLGSGYFTFHNSISIVNDMYDNNSIAIGGMNGARSTQLWKDSIFTDELDTNSIKLAGGSSPELGWDGSHLIFNGYQILTTNDSSGGLPSNLSMSNGFSGTNVNFNDNNSGYFTFNQNISMLNGSSIFLGGAKSSGGTELDPNYLWSQTVEANDVSTNSLELQNLPLRSYSGDSSHLEFNYNEVANMSDIPDSTGSANTAGIHFQGDGIYSDHSDGCVYFNNGISPVDVRGGDFYSHGNYIGSARSIKKDITAVNSHDALAKVLNTDIKSWRYNTDDNTVKKHVGPVIDDLNSNNRQKYYTPNELIKAPKLNENSASFSLNNAISYLFLSVQELQKQNSQLSQRVAKLEFKDNK